MMARGAVGWGVVAVCLAGCGGGREELALSVGAAAQYEAQAGPPAAVGYQVALVIEQATRSNAPDCPKLPSDLRLLVGGVEVPAAFDPSTGCLATTVTPALVDPVGTVTVDAEGGGRSLGHAEFSGLDPGSGATLAVPADGAVHAGDEIVVIPPATLPSATVVVGYVFPLDDTAAPAQELLASRQADGVHLVVPAFSGRAAVTFADIPDAPLPTYSCSGFDICTAQADNTLGPVFVTESP